MAPTGVGSTHRGVVRQVRQLSRESPPSGGARRLAAAGPRRSFPPHYPSLSRAPHAEVSDTSFAVREGSLRPDYQHLYPGVQAGVWYIAASLTSAVSIGQERGSGRVLSDLHFEFRGGDEFHLRPPDVRSRTEDILGR